MLFEITAYKEGSSFCDLHLKWVGPIEIKFYVKKETLGAAIEYIVKNEQAIYKQVTAIQGIVQNAVSPPKP